MKGSRWTEEEDKILAEIVLENVRNGGTQLDAFTKVAKKIGRTPGSCAFRWNAVVRRKEMESFRKAKKERVDRHLKERYLAPVVSFREVIQLVKQQEKEYSEIKKKVSHLEEYLQTKEEEYQRLLEENQQLHRLTSLSPSNYTKELMKHYDKLLTLLEAMKESDFQRLPDYLKVSSSSTPD